MKWFTLLWFALSAGAVVDEATVAVATNFSIVAEQIRKQFEATTGHRIRIVTGSTGKLYAQVLGGAPFDVMLAADQERPRHLEVSEYGVGGSRFTYATGRLVIWSADAAKILQDPEHTLNQASLRSLAIANPKLAPYGIASMELLESTGTWSSVREKIVMGENVGQAFALAATRNADIGIVALSVVLQKRSGQGGYFIVVSPDLHSPIRQDAVLLRRGRENSAATSFLNYLRSPEAIALIRSLGYGDD